jgi:riboflavin kinase/FMN adenylyltransferase
VAFFKPEIEAFQITLAKRKEELLRNAGIDFLFMIKFDKNFAAVTAEEFISGILLGKLKVKKVIVGDDFAFGAGRKGNVDMLRAAAEKNGFKVDIVEKIKSPEGWIYSSTAVRNALRRGDIKSANQLLGREWEIEAEVVHGDARGRDMGFPTANQHIGAYIKPAFGVYAVKVLIEGEDQWRGGVANFGIRPMFKTKKPLLETYIFDFKGDLYGKHIRVHPIEYLRGEQKFETLDSLVHQIEHDCELARKILSAPEASLKLEVIG